MILGKQTATRFRYGQETRDPDTGRTITPASTESSIRGSFQPLDGKEREALPEGVRQSETIKMYTKSDLRTADQHEGTPADEIEYDGRRFVVYQADKWPKLLSHYKALLIRKQEAE